jgi:hypothetical protein
MEEVVTTAPAETPATPVEAPVNKTGQLSTEEMLKLENYTLKTQNLRLHQEQLQSNLLRNTQALQELQREVTAFRTALNDKYGVDLAKVQLRADGTFAVQNGS